MILQYLDLLYEKFGFYSEKLHSVKASEESYLKSWPIKFLLRNSYGFCISFVLNLREF